jgi:hypothetical protein
MIKQLNALGLMAIAGATMVGCQSTDVTWEDGVPRHVAMHDEWSNYQMIYHPDARAYYEPYTQRRFWYQDGAWQEGDAFPIELPFDPERAQVVHVRDIDPEIIHATASAFHGSDVEIPAKFQPPVLVDLPEFQLTGSEEQMLMESANDEPFHQDEQSLLDQIVEAEEESP